MFPASSPRTSLRSARWTEGPVPTLLGLLLPLAFLTAASTPAETGEAPATWSADPAEIAASGLPRDTLLIGPIPGLTTVWHPAPAEAAVPLGTAVRFLRATHPSITLRWQGAREIFRDARWSVAELRPETPGTHHVSVEYRLSNGQSLVDRCRLTAVAFSPAEIVLTPVRVQAPEIEAAPGPDGSIAGLERLGGERYLTSRQRRLLLEVEVEPAAFAPLLEWRVDGRARLRLGPTQALRFSDPGVHRVSAGPPEGGATIEIETYRTVLQHPPDATARLGRGEPVTFTAATEPSGHEAAIRWQLAAADALVSQKTGRGPLFVAHLQPRKEGAEPPSFLLHADDALFHPAADTVDEGFFAGGRLQFSLDPADARCASGLELALTSAGLETGVLRRDAVRPAKDSQALDTELLRLELGAFSTEVGHVFLRRRDGRSSRGKIEDVTQTRGRFLSGRSSLEAFFELELRDLGLSFHTGGEPLRLDAGQVSDPLALGVEIAPRKAGSLPLLAPDSDRAVGWLCHASFTPERKAPPYDPPTQDEDWFHSTGQTTLRVTSALFKSLAFKAPDQAGGGGEPGQGPDGGGDGDPDGPGGEDWELEVTLELSSEGLSPAMVLLDPGPYEPGQEIHTEMVRLELGGVVPGVGEVILRERADLRSRGLITDVEADPDGNFIAGKSTFDLFLEIEVPTLGVILHTGTQPVYVDSWTITGLPPIGGDYEHEEYDPGFGLFNASSLAGGGQILTGNHHIHQEVPCCRADLDIDSDNNNRTAAPDRSQQEDQIETTPPGKYIALNDDDDTPDGQRDLAQEPLDPAEDDVVPMVLELHPNTQPGHWRLTYPDKVQVYEPDRATIIPSGSTFRTSMAPNPKTVLVEGVKKSDALGDVSMTLEYDCDGNQSFDKSDTVVATVIKVDLDVDSDSSTANPDYGPVPQPTQAEDDIEDRPDLPGRYVRVNDNDDNGNGLVDLFDGFGTSANGAERNFVRMVLEVPAPVDLSVATLQFVYSAVPPTLVGPSQERLRIWTRNGNQLRNPNPVSQNGHFVDQATPYAASALGLSNQQRTVNLWLEGIFPSLMEPDRIEVQVDPDGEDGSADFVAKDAVRVSVVALDFIADDNTVIQTTGTAARLMISNNETELTFGWNIFSDPPFPQPSITFDGPPTMDPDNFRVQLVGLPPSVQPSIAVNVLEANGGQRSTATYGTLGGTLGGSRARRTDQQLRLVSNTEDDGVGGNATRLVRIDGSSGSGNDSVRAEVTLGASQYTAELPVCRPPGESVAEAIRTGTVRFVNVAGVTHNSASTLDWLNENWAQLCIRFRSTGAATAVTPLSNALRLEGAATGTGNLTVTINGTAVSVQVQTILNPPNPPTLPTLAAIAQALATQITTATGLPAAVLNHLSDRLVVVNRGVKPAPTFTAVSDTVPGVSLTHPNLSYTGTNMTVLAGSVLAFNYKDNNPETVDFFAVGTAQIAAEMPSLGQNLFGLSGFDGSAAAGFPAWVNTIFVVEHFLPPGVGTNTNLPGHEIGHVLLNQGGAAHQGINEDNVMWIPSYGKRLKDPQNTRVRQQSGPGSNGPLLLRQN